ncbi:hypothetical protein Tsubulata_029574 [Turnera subulata]|uniref:NAB domain-containing protein n=1 Tax=Turnera subulata TaxID=218843 RepID=A0A9Q0J7A3_9ROSI|nr:hypothetical protein Tsubulata_029574 [Turnera subulata]
MAATTPAASKRKYSWWWDSHISPKNSKWLQENLTDMDVKVKQMIKLIEEDADSFARRAEMYYKKRPELMKLVEEFYRAYRALAERYDHATGALRQAHRTMAEAFPNQIPFMLSDDSPGFLTDGDPRALFDSDEQQKDVSGISPFHAHSTRRNGAFTDESDSVLGRKGLKQFNDLFGSGDGLHHGKFAEGRARKGLNFNEAEEKDRGLQNSGIHETRARVPSDSERMSKAELEILNLKNALAKLEAEKDASLLQYQQNLERLSNLESEVSCAKEDSKGFSERASRAEAEVQSLKDALAKLDSEREASLSKYQQCLEKIASLENSISLAQKDAGELDERASKAETEVESLKKDLARLEAEKEAAVVQYEKCLERISELEQKLLHAEEDCRRSNERADGAEREVETLKQALAKLAEEKEDAANKYLQCLETIANLEHKLACALEEVQRLKNEIDEGAVKLEGVEEKCSLLERSNQTMHSELESLAQKVVAQSEELTEKQKELGRLWTCIQEERLRFVEAETAFQTLQDLHSQSREELRSMADQLKNRAQILEDLEARNRIIQHELEEVKVENRSLSNVNLSSGLTIKNLEDEISGLRETIRKLEAEVELRVDQRNALQQEIYCLKEELNDLNKKHQVIMGQVELVGFSAENFGSSVKSLQEENLKLQDLSERDRSEKAALMEKLEVLEKLVEKNALLENSLSDLNVELEGVREKMKALEEYCESLSLEKSTLVSEKASLVSELQNATSNMEKLTEQNHFLENSLLDANAEIEGLNVKSKNLEDLCSLLESEKSDLASLRGSLISQLDISQKRMEDLEKNYMDLENKYFDLERHKQSMVHEVEELQVCLDAEKQEHATLAWRSKTQLADMESQIHLLQEEAECRKEEYEEELDKAVNAEMEIFILQQCMQDLEERKSSLVLEHQKLLEASKLSDQLISQLKCENVQQQSEVKHFFDQINSLRGGLGQVLMTLELEANLAEFKAEHDQALLNLVLNKVQETQKLLLKMQDKNQELVIENSVLVTLLGQLQQEVKNLVLSKNSLDQELSTRSEHVTALKCESKKLLEVSEDLRLKIKEGDHREEVLKAELTNLHGQLSDLECAYRNIQLENCKVLAELGCVKNSVSDLREEKCNLEYKNFAIFGEAVSQSTLSIILGAVIRQKLVETKELSENLNNLHRENLGLIQKMKTMEEKLDELSGVVDEKAELLKIVEELKFKYDEVDTIRVDLEKKLSNLSGDYDQQRKAAECIQEANQKLESQLLKLHGELQEVSLREGSLIFEVLKEKNDVELWESEATSLFQELQASAVQEAVFEGKTHELIQVCEKLEVGNYSKSMEIDQLKSTVSFLEGGNAELKTQMTAYLPAFISLRNSIASLENHVLSDAARHGADMEAKDAATLVDAERCQQISEEQSAMQSGGFAELKELQKRIRAIEKAAMEKERLIMLENLTANSKLESALKLIDELKSGSSLRTEGLESGKHVNQKQEGRELGAAPGNDLRLPKRTHEISEEGGEVMTKDIMLDQISECSSYGISRRETLEADNQMLEIWETTGRNGSIDLTVGKTLKATTTGTEKKHKGPYPSTESLVEKEVGVDRLEISKRLSGSFQEGNGKKILERLDSDAQKLTNLQITVQDLKKKVEFTEKSTKGKGFEYGSVKEQLEESEEAILKLLDVNHRLMKCVEDESVSSSVKSALTPDENMGIQRRKISEQARRVSEKIGRLQLEVQKLHFLLLKLDDENKSRGKTKITERNTRVLLRDYLYGKTRPSQKRKKKHFCSCMQPPTD